MHGDCVPESPTEPLILREREHQLVDINYLFIDWLDKRPTTSPFDDHCSGQV